VHGYLPVAIDDYTNDRRSEEARQLSQGDGAPSALNRNCHDS
jgi:hypothetical protein